MSSSPGVEASTSSFHTSLNKKSIELKKAPHGSLFYCLLVIRIAFVVERLDVRIVALIHFRNLILEQFLVIVAAHGSSVHQQIGILDCRNDDAEDADSHAYTLRMNVVDDTCRLHERVGIDFQFVQLPVGVQQFFMNCCTVDMGEDTSEVAHVVVDDVALNAVARLNALHDVVFHLPAHIAVGGTSDGSGNQQDDDDGGADNDFAETASCELLGGILLFVGVGIKLFHNSICFYLLMMQKIHKLLACFCLVEGTAELTGRRDAILFLYATHLHTHVAGFNDNHHAEGV